MERCLTVDGFLFLCTPPLTQLGLGDCFIDATATAEAAAGPLCSAPVTVASTWTEAESPHSGHTPVLRDRVVFAVACVDALAGLAHIVSSEARSGTPGQPTLQRLVGGWDIGYRFMHILARMPSLVELVFCGGMPEVHLTAPTV